MARYVDAIDLPIPIEEAFDYLAAFSRNAEWDPGLYDARRLTRGKVRLGSRFELVGIRRLADPALDLLFQRIGRSPCAVCASG